MLVNIRIRDVNDHSPTFETPSNLVITVKIPESARINSKYILPRAHDYDVGSNSIHSYSLVLTWYKKNRVEHVDKARDCLDYFCGFPNRENKFYVSEKRRKNNFLKKESTRLDGGKHLNGSQRSGRQDDASGGSSGFDVGEDKAADIARIVGTFELELVSGDLFLSLKQALDQEDVEEYGMKLVVADGGKERRSSSAEVRVEVKDINDNAPFFEQSSYHFSIPEDLAVLSILNRLQAWDLDAGRNGHVCYSFVQEKPLVFVSHPSHHTHHTRQAVGGVHGGDYDVNESGRMKNNVFRTGIHKRERRKGSRKEAVKKQATFYTGANHQMHSHNQYREEMKEVFKNYKKYKKQKRQFRERGIYFGKQEIASNDKDHSKVYKSRKSSRHQCQPHTPSNNSNDYLSEVQPLFSFSLPWALDRETGDLILVSQLHYTPHADNRHSLMVQAVDAGTSRLTGYAQVTVAVVDVNNHAPQLEYNSIYQIKKLNHIPTDYVFSEKLFYGSQKDGEDDDDDDDDDDDAVVAAYSEENLHEKNIIRNYKPVNKNRNNMGVIKGGNKSEIRRGGVPKGVEESEKSVSFSYYALPVSMLLKHSSIDYVTEPPVAFEEEEENDDGVMSAPDDDANLKGMKAGSDKTEGDGGSQEDVDGRSRKILGLGGNTLKNEQPVFFNGASHKEEEKNNSAPENLLKDIPPHQQDPTIVFSCSMGVVGDAEFVVASKKKRRHERSVSYVNTHHQQTAHYNGMLRREKFKEMKNRREDGRSRSMKEKRKGRMKKKRRSGEVPSNILGYLSVEDRDVGLNQLTTCSLLQSHKDLGNENDDDEKEEDDGDDDGDDGDEGDGDSGDEGGGDGGDDDGDEGGGDGGDEGGGDGGDDDGDEGGGDGGEGGDEGGDEGGGDGGDGGMKENNEEGEKNFDDGESCNKECERLYRSLLEFQLLSIAEDQYELVMRLAGGALGRFISGGRHGKNKSQWKKHESETHPSDGPTEGTSGDEAEDEKVSKYRAQKAEKTGNSTLRHRENTVIVEDKKKYSDKNKIENKKINTKTKTKNKKLTKGDTTKREDLFLESREGTKDRVVLSIRSLVRLFFAIRLTCHNANKPSMLTNLELNFKFYDDVCHGDADNQQRHVDSNVDDDGNSGNLNESERYQSNHVSPARDAVNGTSADYAKGYAITTSKTGTFSYSRPLFSRCRRFLLFRPL